MSHPISSWALLVGRPKGGPGFPAPEDKPTIGRTRPPAVQICGSYVSELRALGSHHQWWFPGSSAEPLVTWLNALPRRPEWSLLRDHVPSSVEISTNQV
ncbi:MAG TPA: hypothetical protein VGH31_07265 [Acidimicrobiales bacterium]